MSHPSLLPTSTERKGKQKNKEAMTEQENRSQNNHTTGKFELIFHGVSQAIREGHKVVVVSKFTSTLDLLRKFFSDQDLRTFTIDGRTSTEECSSFVEKFNHDKNKGPQVKWFLHVQDPYSILKKLLSFILLDNATLVENFLQFRLDRSKPCLFCRYVMWFSVGRVHHPPTPPCGSTQGSPRPPIHHSRNCGRKRRSAFEAEEGIYSLESSRHLSDPP